MSLAERSVFNRDQNLYREAEWVVAEAFGEQLCETHLQLVLRILHSQRDVLKEEGRREEKKRTEAEQIGTEWMRRLEKSLSALPQHMRLLTFYTAIAERVQPEGALATLIHFQLLQVLGGFEAVFDLMRTERAAMTYCLEGLSHQLHIQSPSITRDLNRFIFLKNRIYSEMCRLRRAIERIGPTEEFESKLMRAKEDALRGTEKARFACSREVYILDCLLWNSLQQTSLQLIGLVHAVFDVSPNIFFVHLVEHSPPEQIALFVSRAFELLLVFISEIQHFFLREDSDKRQSTPSESTESSCILQNKRDDTVEDDLSLKEFCFLFRFLFSFPSSCKL